jgi:crotonobetaine/carnitine-CoA ligase
MKYDIDADLPLNSRTLPAIWLTRISSTSEASFLWFPERDVESLHTFHSSMISLASGLHAIGLRKGDRACLLMKNSPEMLQTMLALWYLGVIVVPLNAHLMGPLLQDQVTRAEPSLMITDVSLFDQVPSELQNIIGSERFLVNAGETLNGELHSKRLDDLRITGSQHPDVSVNYWDTAMILYTSGSTGPSKGCVLNHHFCVYYAWVFWRYMGYQSNDTIFTCLPLSHVHALFASFWPAVLAQARFAFSKRFSASRYWEEIAESGATTSSAIGTMPSILLAQAPSEWEKKIRVRLMHIAPAPPRVEEFQTRFRLKVVSVLYGLTEAMVFPPSIDSPPVFGLLGPSPPDWDVRIVDDRGQQVEINAPGELVVRPLLPNILFEGYYNQPEETLRAFRGLWFHTGDLCRRDEHGLFWFKGRQKDVIRRRGENVSVWELEAVIAQNPGIREVAAFAVPSQLGDEDIAVVAVRQKNTEVDFMSLQTYCSQNLPKYMRPDRLIVRDSELPKTVSGKVDKNLLRKELK